MLNWFASGQKRYKPVFRLVSLGQQRFHLSAGEFDLYRAALETGYLAVAADAAGRSWDALLCACRESAAPFVCLESNGRCYRITISLLYAQFTLLPCVQQELRKLCKVTKWVKGYAHEEGAYFSGIPRPLAHAIAADIVRLLHRARQSYEQDKARLRGAEPSDA